MIEMSPKIFRARILSAMLLGGALATVAVPAHAREAKAASAKDEAPRQKSRTADGARTSVTPYLEVSQVVFAELSPGSDVLTYTNQIGRAHV